MSLLFRLIAVMGAVLLFTSIVQAQFISEDDIPLEIQTQIIEQIVAEHGHLDIVALEQVFREWVLSQPLPDADGQMVDSGLCGTCEPPTDNEDPDFPPVRDIRIVTRTRPNGMLRRNFTVRWRRPVRLPRAIRGEYELDHYEVFLSRDDGTFEQHVIGKQQRADGTEKLPRRIRFRRRDAGQYHVSVRPVYLPIEETEASASVRTSDGVLSATPLTQSSGQLTSGVPATRMLSSGLKKGPGSSPPVVEVGPDSTVNEAFISGVIPVNSNQALYDCIVNDHSYTGGTEIGTISALNCADEGISRVEELEHFAGLVTLNLGNLDGSTSNNNSICDINKLEGLNNLTSLTLSGNSTFSNPICMASLAQMQELRYLLLDRIELTSLPPLSVNADLLTLSLADNNLGVSGYSCDSTPLPVSLLDISNNNLKESHLSLLSSFVVSRLNGSNNDFSSFTEPSCSGIQFANLSHIDLSGNGSAGAFGGIFQRKPLSGDIGNLQLGALNLSGSDFSELPAQMPIVCLDLNLSQMNNLSGWALTSPDNIPTVRPYSFRLDGSDGLSCADSQSFRFWMMGGAAGSSQTLSSPFGPSGPSSPTAGICPALSIPIVDNFADRCDPGEVDNFSAELSSEQPYHVMGWDPLYLERQFRTFEYRVQKRFAGIHPPGSDNGIIPPTYSYGASGSAIISDTVFDVAYEFRIQRCLLESGVLECNQKWGDWQDSGYPLIKPINPQVVWVDPIAGVYYLTWSYPQSYFEGETPSHFLIDDGVTLVEQTALPFVASWRSADMTTTTNGSTIAISACQNGTPTDPCGESLVISFSAPVELNQALTPPTLGASINGNEAMLTMQNTVATVNDGQTVVDYYQVEESGPTGLTVYYKDISDQVAGVTTDLAFKRIEGGDYTFTVSACQRNRNGQDSCSSSNTFAVNGLSVPLGFNTIDDTLCWQDLGNNDIQLEWQYSTEDDAFNTPAFYQFSRSPGPPNDFTINAMDHTDGLGVTRVRMPPGSSTLIKQGFWAIDACELNGNNCQPGVGYINARSDEPGPLSQCATPPPPQAPETRTSGGPGDLRPGVFVDTVNLPRQGWTFFWASDLRYDDVHEEYGDTYDLYAYWQTYQFDEASRTYKAVWLYAELKQELDGSGMALDCNNDNNNPPPDSERIVFKGGLYFPNGNTSSTDMHGGDMQVCFDPENNNVVDINLNMHLDGGLQTNGETSYTLGEISTSGAIATGPANPQDYHNGSFRFGAATTNQDKTRLISWNYSYLEGLIVLGFDNTNQPIWVNGVLDCNNAQTVITETNGNENTMASTCTAIGTNGRANVDGAKFSFRTARLGLPPLAIPPPNGDDLITDFATINTVTRNKALNASESASGSGGQQFNIEGNLAFQINDLDEQFIRSFNYSFSGNNLSRESSFHDIRYSGAGISSTNGDCPIVNGQCEINLTWFSDSDFLGTGVPSIQAFYQRNGATPQPLDGSFCGAGDPVADPDNDFTVVDYSCLISQGGDYVFMLINRVGVNGLPVEGESTVIARSQTLNVIAENTSSNDDLGVVLVADTPLAIGATVHDHSMSHMASIGTLAGEAGVSGGAASYSIPINIPPGRQGMQPSVSLSYNSRAGNGTVGMGWSLSAGSAISRCPSTIAQDGFSKGVTYTNTDRLCIDGQRLMVVSGAYWAPDSDYRTEIDSFSRVTLNGSGAANNGCTTSFTVLGKDNITRDYGNGDNQRVMPVAVSGGGCVANSWLLTQERDTAGNRVDYSYTNNNAGDGEQLLSRIDYTGNASGVGDRNVRFGYDTRTIGNVDDTSVSYLAGYRSEQTRRLSTVSTFVGNDQVRQYNLEHIVSSATARLLLDRVEECAYENGVEAVCLNPTQFEWGDDAPMFAWEAIQTAQDADGIVNDILVDGDPLGYDPMSNRVNGGRLEQLFDLDGDGSRELFFSDQSGSYIASVDAEGVERWRVSMALDASFGTRSNGSPQEFVLASMVDTAVETQRYAELVDRYVAGIDLNESLPAGQIGQLSPAEEQAMRESIAQNANEQLEDVFRNRLPRRNDVDYDGDGIVDLHGIVPSPGNNNQHRFAFALSSAANFQNGPFESQFTVLPTNIPVPVSDITGEPFFQAVIGDINGDGLMDVLDRVTLQVTDLNEELGPTEALRLWINIDNPATTTEIEFEKFTGGIPLDQQNAVTAVEGLIYIWPYNIPITIGGNTTYEREISALPSLTDYNGDGLQDIVISSNLADVLYQNTQFADLTLNVILQTGYQEANVRVLLNRASTAESLSFEIAELSDDTVANDPHSRGSNHLGLFSDPRVTYQVPMDVNGDGLQDYLYTPNNIDRDADSLLCSGATDGCWYLQLNLGGAINSVQPIFSAPIQVNLPTSIFNSMQTLGVDTGRNIVPPIYGNLIRPMDWNNDGRTELLIPRELDRAACVALQHSQSPNRFGEYCPVNMNNVAPTFIQAGVDGDFNEGPLAHDEVHRAGYGHLDRSTYKMAALEFDMSTLSSGSITLSMIDHDVTGIIASNRSTVDDGFGDGISDLLTVFGCIGEVPGVPIVGDNFTRCRTSGPLAPVNVSNAPLNALLDTAATTAYSSNLPSGSFRGYYISRNQMPRESTLDLMLSVTDGFNNRSNWSYAPLSSNPPEREGLTTIPLYVVPDRSDGDGYVDNAAGEYFYFASSMYVVSQFDQSNGLVDGGVRLHNITFYGYEEAVFNNQGRGFQGFRKVVSEQITDNPTGQHDDSGNDLRSVSIFHQLFPLAGRMEAGYTQLASIPYNYMQDRDPMTGAFQLPTQVLSSTDDMWGCRIGTGDVNDAGDYAGLCNTGIEDGNISAAQAEIITDNDNQNHGIYQPVMLSMVSESRELDGTSIYARTTNDERSYDGYGNLLAGTSSSENIDLANGATLLTHTQTVANTYINTEFDTNTGIDWWLGRMSRSETRSDSDYLNNGDVNTEQVKTTTQLMDYNTGLRKPNCIQTVDGSSSAACGSGTGIWQRTRMEYDTHGNPTSVLVQASDPINGVITERETETDYSTGSDIGYFPVSIENAEDHTVLTQIEPREGNPTMVMDANDLITRMAYDPFGRSIDIWYPNNSDVGAGLPDLGASLIEEHYAPRSSTRYSTSCSGSPVATAYCMTSISDGAPLVFQSMDSLNRAIEVRSNGFAGNTSISQQYYNGRGQMVEDTVPRYIGGFAFTNEYRYDGLGRMIFKAEATQTNSQASTSEFRYTHYVHTGLTSTVLVGNDTTALSCVTGDADLNDDLCVDRTYATNGWLLSTTDAHAGVTTYRYDGQGNPTLILDIHGNDTTAMYNNLGHRNTLNDPNMGVWNYTYNGLGEVIRQTDANQKDFSFEYDRLGRLIERVAIAGCSNSNSVVDSWAYDGFGQQQGLLLNTERSDCDGSNMLKAYDYDSFTRPVGIRQTITSANTSVTNMSIISEYDQYFGRPKAMVWRVDGTGTGTNALPTLSMYNKYDINGYLVEQGDSRIYQGDDTAAYNTDNPGAWRRVQALTPTGQVQTQRFGNGLTQVNQYYPATWQMENTFIDDPQPDSPDFMNYFYRYDLFGNLEEQVSHNLSGVGGDTTVDQEAFVYDRLHRLTKSTRTHSINNGATTSTIVDYEFDALGNIMSKGDFATSYEYGGSASNGGPNAVSSVNLTGSGGPITYSYDNNGNMISASNGRTMVYDVYNKPVDITNSSAESNEFWYDADEQRYLQRKNGGATTTHYLDKMYERTGNVHKLYMDDFAVFTVDYANDQNTGITYLHKDRLGSVAVMSTSQQEPINGTSKGYDPFGKPRDGDWTDGDGDLNGYEESTRGFTGHEHLNETDLIHMNGRTYDYNLGRFLSVDPVIQAPQNSQSLNPYSYIMNNPLSGTDPTGYTSFGLNGGKCGEFTTGSCDSAFFGNGTDERENRRNGKSTTSTQGATTPGSNIVEIGDLGENSPNNSLNAQNQMDGVDPDADLFGVDVESGQRVAVIPAAIYYGGVAICSAGACELILAGLGYLVGDALVDAASDEGGFVSSDGLIDLADGLSGLPSSKPFPSRGGFAEDGGGLSDLRGPTFNEEGAGNAAQGLDDLSGLSIGDAEEKLRAGGFTKKSTTAGGADKWTHSDGSFIWVKPTGDISRLGPSRPNSADPHNSPNVRDRFGPSGKLIPHNPGADTHNTGETVRRN